MLTTKVVIYGQMHMVFVIFLTLYRETTNVQYLEQADALVNNVHDVLGRERNGKKTFRNSNR